MEYRVKLDIYSGPLDLLLYLIRRDELDILDIPMARVTRSYVEHVQMLRELPNRAGLDIDDIGEFLVMAATLLEIKSAMLLPRHADQAEVAADVSLEQQLSDPRADLIRQLLEYKQIRDHAGMLDARHASHAQRFARWPVLPETNSEEPPPLDMDEVQVWDLLSAFTRLMGEIGTRRKTHDVVYDETPIDLHAADIRDRLHREGRMPFKRLFEGRATRSEMIGMFLALLELIREKRVMVVAAENDELDVIEAPPEHQATYRGASLHLADEVVQPAGLEGEPAAS